MAKKKKKIKHERLKLKQRDWYKATWEICIAGPSRHTDVGTLCGATAWASDYESEEVDQDTTPTCPNCLAIVAWMEEREL